MKAPITIENAQAVVRASSTEQFQLWCLYAEGSGYAYRVSKYDGRDALPTFEDRRGAIAWVEQSLGFMREIGKVDGRPICVAVSFATIDGVRVAFVDGCSQLVDHAMIEKWIETAMPQAARHQADAMNWRNTFTGLKPDPLPDLPDPPPPEPQPAPPPGPFALPEAVALTIDGMLIVGATLHAFRSGGGLRVVDLKFPACRYYGEHPHLHEAMRILADDCNVHGGREYSAVYGPIETHYLTGDSSPADALDAWVLGGRTIDARSVDGQIEVSLHGLEMSLDLPPAVLAGDYGSDGVVRWTCPRGFTFESRRVRFANQRRLDKPYTSTVAVAAPEGRKLSEATCWSSVRRARASTFVEAASLALAAEPIEEIEP